MSNDKLAGRLPSLDGWRALSILLVLGSHSTRAVNFPKAWIPFFKWGFDGDLGVRFFFVISGFLITFLLIREHQQTARIALQKFYFRRALRILPVYFAFLLFMWLLQIFSTWNQPAITWIGNVTFLTNFLPGNWNTGHLWSLAVEEQFYLLWPILLAFLLRQRRTATVIGVLFVPILLAPFCRVVGYLKKAPAIIAPIFESHSFFCYFDSLAVGCIAAFLLQKTPLATKISKIQWPMLALPLVFLAIPYILTKLLIVGIVTVPFGPLMQAIGFAFILLVSVLKPEFFKPLNNGLVCKLGVLSYSIYIWQQFFFTNPIEFGFPKVWFMTFPSLIVAILLTGAGSYYFLEKPLLKLREKLATKNKNMEGYGEVSG